MAVALCVGDVCPGDVGLDAVAECPPPEQPATASAVSVMPVVNSWRLVVIRIAAQATRVGTGVDLDARR